MILLCTRAAEIPQAVHETQNPSFVGFCVLAMDTGEESQVLVDYEFEQWLAEEPDKAVEFADPKDIKEVKETIEVTGVAAPLDSPQKTQKARGSDIPEVIREPKNKKPRTGEKIKNEDQLGDQVFR